jgi:two-component system chemotaxis response regulator CheB
MTVRVVVVDDSALVRSVLTELINRSPGMEVVGQAADPFEAREKIRELDPDVITLDVEMPRMDGLAFLERLMKLRPMPVVMISTLTERGAQTTLRALELGAVDFVAKPTLDVKAGLDELAREITGKLRAAAQARVGRRAAPPPVSAPRAPKAPVGSGPASDLIVAIGASTGGTEAIKDVLTRLPPDTPGVVIAQHIPKAFSTPFAKRMNDCCQMTVYEAEDGQQVLAGHVYIAPGDRHLMVVRDGARYVLRLDDGVPVNRHKPSVDVLFRSVAQNAGRNAIGVILTGMGKDGAKGLKEMLDAGSQTIAQDEATSVVWGMPGEAVSVGAAQHVIALDSVAGKIRSLADSMDITRQAREA